MEIIDDIMLQAAKSALARLPAMEAEYARLHSEMQRLANKINQYKNIVISADLQLPDPNTMQQSTPAQSPAASQPDNSPQAQPGAADKKAPKGECMRHIEDILTSELMPVNALQVAIHQKHAALYGISTLYANLQKGQKDGRFVNEGGKWRKV